MTFFKRRKDTPCATNKGQEILYDCRDIEIQNS